MNEHTHTFVQEALTIKIELGTSRSFGTRHVVTLKTKEINLAKSLIYIDSKYRFRKLN